MCITGQRCGTDVGLMDTPALWCYRGVSSVAPEKWTSRMNRAGAAAGETGSLGA